jgi:hypothetical protein
VIRAAKKARAKTRERGEALGGYPLAIGGPTSIPARASKHSGSPTENEVKKFSAKRKEDTNKDSILWMPSSTISC